MRARDLAAFPELQQLQSACDDSGCGFYFEEGGCWGMAKALFDYFSSRGYSPTYRVQTDFWHCYAECQGRYYDYTGEVHQHPDLPPLTEQEMLALMDGDLETYHGDVIAAKEIIASL